MSQVTKNTNAQIGAGMLLKIRPGYKPLLSQRKLPPQANKWQQWDKYIHWPSEHDQMELNLEFKEVE